MQNKMKENVSFKYYIYMVAKSRAINHIKVEKRRTEIAEEYLYNFAEDVEKDVLEFITKEETKKEIIEAIELLDEKYKSRIATFPEVSEINFDENFIVIIANENYRDFDEIDMEISNVYADEDATNIIMKQKENPNMNDTTNVWYAIVDNSQLKDNVKITVEHKDFNNETVIEISKLPLDYSVDTAIEDGCFTLKNNKVVSSNEKQLDEFIEKTEKCFVRIYSNYDGNISITDVNFEDGIYYVNRGSPNREEKYRNTYKKLVKRETQNGDYKDIGYVFYEERNSNDGVPLVIIQNWLEDYRKNHK